MADYSVTHLESREGEVRLQLEVPPEEVERRYEEVVEEYRRKAKIPGFRPGKVPAAVIRQRLGRELWAEVAEEIARRYMQEAIREEGYRVGGSVRLRLIDYGPSRTLKAEAIFPLMPQVKLRRYKDLPVLLTDAEVTDRDVEEQLELLRHRFARYVESEEPATVNVRLTLKVKEVDPSGLPLVGREEREEVLEFGMDRLGRGSDEQLLGIRKGERRLVKVTGEEQLITRAADPERVLRRGETQGRTADGWVFYQVEAMKVEVPQLPEVGEELAQLVNPQLKSGEDLMDYIRISLMGMVAERVQRALREALIQRLIEENPFPLPESLVEETLARVAHDLQVSEEDWPRFRDENRSQAERDYRWVLIRDAIAQAEGIEVSDEEVEQEFQRIAEVTGESIGEVKTRLGEGEALERLRGRLYERRILDFLAQHAKIERRMVDLNTFLRTYPD